MPRQVVVAGSTGLVGTQVLEQLAGRADLRVTALVRRATAAPRPDGIEERVFAFEPPGDYRLLGSAQLPCDVLLCCVGTTMRQAGTQAAFRRVERDVPLALASGLVAAGPGVVFGFVSSAGAGRPTGFYLRTKAETEHGIVASGVRYVVVRPSLLLGDRRERRLAERAATVLLPPVMRALAALTLGRVAAVGRLLPIRAERVAAALIYHCIDHAPATSRVIEGYALQGSGRPAER